MSIFVFLWYNFQMFTQIHHTADLLCKFCENSYGLSAGVYSKSSGQPLFLLHSQVRAESKGIFKQVLALPWLVFRCSGKEGWTAKSWRRWRASCFSNWTKWTVCAESCCDGKLFMPSLRLCLQCEKKLMAWLLISLFLRRIG